MQDAGVGAAGDDGRVSMAAGAADAEFVTEFGFQHIFPMAGAAGAHGAQMRIRGNVGGAAHDVNLTGILDQAHALQRFADVAQDGRRAPARA